MSLSIFKFLKKNLEKNDVFYALIEKILERTHSHSFFLEFFEFGANRINESPPFGNKFLEVMCKYMIDLKNKIEHTPYKAFPVPITKNFFTILLRKYCDNPFNFNYERAIVLIIQFFAEGRIFNEFDPKPYLSEQILPGQAPHNNDNLAFGRSLLEMLLLRIKNKEYNFIHLVVYLATKYPSADEAVVKLQIDKIALQLIKEDGKYKQEAQAALQWLISFDAHYQTLLKNNVDIELLNLLEQIILKEDASKDDEYVKNFLKTVYLIFSKKVERIEILEEKLFEMIKKYKKNRFFVDKVLLSFFEFKQLKFTKFVQSLSKPEATFSKSQVESSGTDSSQNLFKLVSSSFTKEKLETLSQITKNMCDEKVLGLLSKYQWKKEVETSFETEDFSQILEQKLFTKSPVLFICNCENNGSIVSLVFFSPTGFEKTSTANQGFVPNSNNCYISIIESSNHFEYKPPTNSEKFLEYKGSDPLDISITFNHDGQQKIKLSMNEDINSFVDLYPLKPVNEVSEDYEFPYDLHINNLEVFVLAYSEEVSETVAVRNNFYDQLTSITCKNNLINVPQSIFSDSFIFELPEEITIKGIETALKIAVFNQDKNKSLKDFSEELVILKASRPVNVIENKDLEDKYNPKNPVFEVFLKKGGMNYLISKIIDSNSIEMFKTAEIMEAWRNLMKAIMRFESLEGFLLAMIQNKEFFSIIFELLVGDPKSTRDWAQTELNISWLILQKLATILSNTNSIEMRIKFLKLNVLDMLLQKIQYLTNEIKRTYDDSPETVAPEPTAPPAPPKEEIYTKEIKKRKGVGYEKEGSGKKWIVADYLTKRKQKTEFMIDILRLFLFIFDREYPETEELTPIKQGWYKQICESCFLPLLEGAMKCSSLHEMAKDFELNKLYCDVLLTVAERKPLHDLLKPIPKVYKPQQLESMLDILLKQEENTILFKKFSETEAAKKEKIDSIDLADKILATISHIKSLYPTYFASLEDKEEHLSEETVNKILEMPVNDRYKMAIKGLSFGLTNMKKNEEYDHHYASSLNSEQKSSSASRSIRLAQEIADLTASLPVDSYNAIFVRSDENRLDLMKGLIGGAEGTPYANGLFEYHVYLPADYPNCPPKCNLETTGSGDIRFNPNLYSCGKVCLSLLGTWRGNASENWDPKISNLLQLFLSIQSVVMSEEVYFNEPGYEHEAGTEEGENRNEAYSNIVRIGNIKFAMIGQIKKPIHGFEEVIRRHFYIKKDVVLKEVGTWIKMAEVRNASYTGLVTDHNHKYAQRFAENPKNYISDLKTCIKDLEEALKGLIANYEISQIYCSSKHKKAVKGSKDKSKSKESNKVLEEKLKEKIDVTYDPEAKQEVFDAEDAKVADRWSRYIGVLGIDAVKKQSKASVFLLGITAAGLEIAKNLVLSGLKRLELGDWKTLKKSDLSTNFYAEDSNIGTNRATAILSKLRQLNCYVKIDAREIKESTDWSFLDEFDVIVICDNYLPITSKMFEIASNLKKKVLISEAHGIYTRIFCDFGDQFEVLDRDGEEPAECFIKSIDYDTNRIILFEKSTHLLRPGDMIQLVEVVSKEDAKLKPLNKSVFKIKNFNKITEIDIEENLKDYQQFDRNGKVKELKIPLKMKFNRYSIKEQNIDPQLSTYDFAKFDYAEIISKCFTIKESFEQTEKIPFSKISREQFNKLLSTNFPPEEKKPEVVQSKPDEKPKEEPKKEKDKVDEKPKELAETKEQKVDDKQKEIVEVKDQKPEDKSKEIPESKEKLPLTHQKLRHMLIGSFGCVHSIAAFVGGVASQEVIKSITNKYVPISQSFFCDFEELLDDKISTMSDDEFWAFIKQIETDLESSRTSYLKNIFGPETFKNVQNSKLFMVGAGAIGCELLKNLSLVYFGTGTGQITLTDPDNIELSNLSRQFLFREKHISKPKALVAAKVIESMNPEYAPGKIVAKLEKVCDETENTFSNNFFKEQSICLNALDNVRARVYMDQRCVRNSVPLLESGTLGPKCHLQVIIPFLTENYGQVQDAKEENSIPICTLKMFPEEPIHCMEWAKDKFDEFYTQNPKNLSRVLEEMKKSKAIDSIDFKIIKKALKFLKSKPNSVDDCVEYARKLFQKYFYNKIKQLLHVYPLDFKGKDGKLFWTLPKRPPTPLEFDCNNPAHMAMIQSAVRLMLSNWSMEKQLPKDFDWVASLAKVKVDPFVPKEGSLETIKKSVEKEGKKEEAEEENPEDVKKKLDDQAKRTKELVDLIDSSKAVSLLPQLKEEIFEKDDDKNGHVDFITALTNLRSKNYLLPEMEWISVKLKAGRIVPALATTTAAVAGLQTVEAIKILKKLQLDKYKNVFMNMSIPLCTMSEPGPVVKYTITPNLKVSVWDQWCFSFTSTKNQNLEHLFNWIKEEYKITPKDLMKGSKPIFLSIINKWEDFKDKKLDELLDMDDGDVTYVTAICFGDDAKKPLENVPSIKVTFNK